MIWYTEWVFVRSVVSYNRILMLLFFTVVIYFQSCSDEILSSMEDISDVVVEDVSFEDIQDLSDVTDVKDGFDLSDISDSKPIDSPAMIVNKEYYPLLKKIIQSASENIIILHQEFLSGSTLDQLQNDLISAKKRGVDVRVLLERDVDENSARVDSLRANGIDAALDNTSKTLHLKLVLADNRHLLLGSSNFSYSAFQYNNEVNMYFNDTTLAKQFYNYAEGVLANNSGLARIYCSGCDIVPIGDTQYADIVVPYINNASKYVFVIMYEFSYDTDESSPNGKITKALIDARSRGATLKILLENSSFDQILNSTNQKTASYLRSKGMEVRFDSVDTVTHAKLLIADDTVVVYSGNWVYSSLTKNHEVGVVLKKKEITDIAINYFNALFNSAK